MNQDNSAGGLEGADVQFMWTTSPTWYLERPPVICGPSLGRTETLPWPFLVLLSYPRIRFSLSYRVHLLYVFIYLVSPLANYVEIISARSNVVYYEDKNFLRVLHSSICIDFDLCLPITSNTIAEFKWRELLPTSSGFSLQSQLNRTRSLLFSMTILTDYSHVPMIRDRLKGRSLARHLASIPPRARQIHVVQDNRTLSGLVPLNANSRLQAAAPDRAWRGACAMHDAELNEPDSIRFEQKAPRRERYVKCIVSRLI